MSTPKKSYTQKRLVVVGWRKHQRALSKRNPNQVTAKQARAIESELTSALQVMTMPEAEAIERLRERQLAAYARYRTLVESGRRSGDTDRSTAWAIAETLADVVKVLEGRCATEPTL